MTKYCVKNDPYFHKTVFYSFYIIFTFFQVKPRGTREVLKYTLEMSNEVRYSTCDTSNSARTHASDAYTKWNNQLWVKFRIMSDINAVLSSARWSDDSYYLKEFVHKFKLPQLAKVGFKKLSIMQRCQILFLVLIITTAAILNNFLLAFPKEKKLSLQKI